MEADLTLNPKVSVSDELGMRLKHQLPSQLDLYAYLDFLRNKIYSVVVMINKTKTKSWPEYSNDQDQDFEMLRTLQDQVQNSISPTLHVTVYGTYKPKGFR